MTQPAPPSHAQQEAAVKTMPERLKRRSDFLRAARGRHHVTPGFVLQAFDRRDGDPAIRVGYTCSKKVGGAVARNRAKRRLRAAVGTVLPGQGQSGWDYVLIGRRDETATRDWAVLCADLSRALAAIHGPMP